jgi:phosphoribosylamine-glycine ligase
VLFDYITIPEYHGPKNVRLIPMQMWYKSTGDQTGDWVPPIKWMCDFLRFKHTQYDFCIALNYELQRDELFQSVINSIDTPVLCPSKSASRMEHEKLLAKEFMKSIGIPTPRYLKVLADDICTILDSKELPAVLKLDHKHSSWGDQTWVWHDRSYHQIIPKLISKQSSSQNYFIEDHIVGKEVSAHFLCNGDSCCYLGSARDYKKIKEGDVGINTSGLGCYSPVSYVSQDMIDLMLLHANKLVKGMKDQGMTMKGVLYLGYIIDDLENLWLIDINTRPGVPEFITIIEGLDHKILLKEISLAASGNTFSFDRFDILPRSSVCICLRREQYSYSYVRVDPQLYHCIKNDDLIPVNPMINHNFIGAVVSHADTVEEAAMLAYSKIYQMRIGSSTYRTDIGILP